MNRVLLYGALAAAFVLTASAEYSVAVAMHFGAWVSYAFPVAVDAYVLAAVRTRREVPAAITGMVGVNVLAHLVNAGLVPVNVWTVSALSTVAPVIVWRVHHLMDARTGTGAVSPEPETGTAVSEHTETDTVAVSFGTETGTADTVTDVPDTPAVSECAAPVDASMPGDYADTVDGTTDTDTVPEPGGRLSDAELDAVVVLLVRETDPPRSYRQLEERFRELGYSASAARLRASWSRAAEMPVS